MGVMQFINGNKYDGKFKDGKREGFGIYNTKLGGQ